jgi:hypothetical protein
MPYASRKLRQVMKYLDLLIPILSFSMHVHAADTQVPKDLAGSQGKPILSGSGGMPAIPDQNEACRDLKPGESRVAAQFFTLHNSFQYQNFTVTHDATKSNQYNVDIPVDFVGDLEVQKSIFGHVLTPEQIREGLEGDLFAKYVFKANSCFEKYNDRLLDPDGNSFHLRFVPPVKSFPDRIEIKKSDRSDSAHWDTDIDCETIVHETLHLTGLVDHYVEPELINVQAGWGPKRTTKKVLQFNCRPFTEGENVMKDQYEALADKYDYFICECTVANCKKISASLLTTVGPKPKCPPGHKVTDTAPFGEINLEYYSNLIRYTMSATPEDVRGHVYIFNKQPRDKNKPILTRAQAQLIIKPYCTRDNNYIACNQNAYATEEIEGCVEIPKSCEAQ